MRAGQLRHLIRLEKRNSHQDKGGGQSGDWILVADGVAASIEPWKGKELFNASQAQAEVIYRCSIRYRPDIDAAMRVVYQNEVYGIMYIEDPELRHRELVLTLNKGKNLG